MLRVEVSADLRQARVFVSIMGTESERKTALEGLNHATGFLQARVAARLQTRFTPVLGFKLDDSVKKSVELGRLIDEAVASDRKGDASPHPVSPTPRGPTTRSPTPRMTTRTRPSRRARESPEPRGPDPGGPGPDADAGRGPRSPNPPGSRQDPNERIDQAHGNTK